MSWWVFISVPMLTLVENLVIKNTMLAIVLHARDNSKNLERLEVLLEENILTDQWLVLMHWF